MWLIPFIVKVLFYIVCVCYFVDILEVSPILGGKSGAPANHLPKWICWNFCLHFARILMSDAPEKPDLFCRVISVVVSLVMLCQVYSTAISVTACCLQWVKCNSFGKFWVLKKVKSHLLKFWVIWLVFSRSAYSEVW